MTEPKVNKYLESVTIPIGTTFNAPNETPYERNERLLSDAKVDPFEDLHPPQVALQIDETDFATLGNFSLIIGKAKSGKTFLMALLISAIIESRLFLNKIKGCLPEAQNEALYFDTEQSRWHVQRSVKRICRLTGIPVPANLHAYGLRKFDPRERLELIEQAIYANPKVGFVIIDGIRDLVTAINDENEATMIASKLLKWTEERNIHIVTVLHQNKGDQNARGHVGSELTHKAESVLSVTKDVTDPLLMICEAEFCRNKDPRPFAFEINAEGLPVEAVEWELRSTSKKEKVAISDLGDLNTWNLLSESFSKETAMKYSTLIIQIQLAFQKQFDRTLGDHKARELVLFCKNMGWVVQKKERGDYVLGEYKQS